MIPQYPVSHENRKGVISVIQFKSRLDRDIIPANMPGEPTVGSSGCVAKKKGPVLPFNSLGVVLLHGAPITVDCGQPKDWDKYGFAPQFTHTYPLLSGCHVIYNKQMPYREI